ncbi:branched-chain amino acid ABC transporter ATP-binding protein [Calothrix sp. NIES-3974]|nr:branched-chain amino acid ABC transporter ATP-binding protein [Calothrix sp. NIES-3974]
MLTVNGLLILKSNIINNPKALDARSADQPKSNQTSKIKRWFMSAYKILEIQDLSVNYGGIQALKNINLYIEKGEVITLVGANGAGKSTTLRAISKIIKPRSGNIIYNGRNITQRSPHQIVKLGIAHSPEGRRVLARQTVYDNLMLGAYTQTNRQLVREDILHQFNIFPRLAERRYQLAGTLSGGEQQMLAIARALMSRPQLLLLDEPSLGLAPAIVREIFNIIENLRTTGVTILLVEQNANLALKIADRAYILEAGAITLTGKASELINDERVKKAYLG